MVEMTQKMQKCFDEMDDKQKIRMFYELTNIANVRNDIENL